jgi:hypothetical protein
MKPKPPLLISHTQKSKYSLQDATNKEGNEGKRRKKRGNGWVGVEHPNTPTEQDALPRIEVGLLGLTKILAKILASRRENSLARKPRTHTQTHIQASAQQRETRKENREKQNTPDNRRFYQQQ